MNTHSCLTVPVKQNIYRLNKGRVLLNLSVGYPVQIYNFLRGDQENHVLAHKPSLYSIILFHLFQVMGNMVNSEIHHFS